MLFHKSDNCCVLLSAFSLRWKKPSAQLDWGHSFQTHSNYQRHLEAWADRRRLLACSGSPKAEPIHACKQGGSNAVSRVAGHPHTLCCDTFVWKAVIPSSSGICLPAFLACCSYARTIKCQATQDRLKKHHTRLPRIL